ncbi:hypothetical protein BDZ91DRAFT_787782 [Kalaharituber pfeilii]|nr:hypothetical protein BDZ91DRAFT_787782 [Kalaharituber pfeilii]
MSRVNKAILGTHSVLANGGLLAAAGAWLIAKGAQENSMPVVIVIASKVGDAGKIVPLVDAEPVENVHVIYPVFDYVSAELVDLYITNL